jgi:hypothetical protein
LRIAASFKVFALAALLGAGVARADDQPFLTLNTTDIEPELGHELEQNFGWNFGMSHTSFNEFQGESEWEYGFSDRLQLAVSTAYGWSRTGEHVFPPVDAQGAGTWGGIEGEAIYQAMNVYFDPIGLGFKFNAVASPSERGFEARVLLQKNFINDRLRLAANIGGEFGQEKDGIWSDTSALTGDFGIAYNITWAWSAGLEFNVEHDYDGLLIDGRAVPGPTTYFFGPTIQYVAHPWTASLGFQAQLPWTQDPAHAAGYVSRGFASDVERVRVGLRVTRDFY